MSDNEDSTASLGDSKVLSVQDSAGDAITAFNQRPLDGSIIPSSVRRQETGDVFKNEPLRLQLFKKSEILPKESRPLAVESGSTPCEAKVLTW
jgi:hypothetical protein